MSDDGADMELLELLRQHLGLSRAREDTISGDTGVLQDAHFIYNNAIDVAIDMYGTKAAATAVYRAMLERGYSTESWSQHPLHPKSSQGFSDLDIALFVFTMDLLNFSFWSELNTEERYQVDYQGQRWTGYNSLVACLRRALEEGIPITNPRFWKSQRCTDQILSHVFRSATAEQIPLLDQRISVLQEASHILSKDFASEEDEEDGSDTAEDEAPPISTDVRSTIMNVETVQDEDAHVSVVAESTDRTPVDTCPPVGEPSDAPAHLVDKPPPQLDDTSQPHTDIPNNTSPQQNGIADEANIRHADIPPDHTIVTLIRLADHSAGKLVNLLAKHFPCFRDETRFEGRKVRILKRAQIFVADLWASLNGTGLGEFRDIDQLTMFADYRVPQSLHSLGVLIYSPPLDHRLRKLEAIEPGHPWEVQLRGCSIWAVELIRREILQAHPEAIHINAVLIDFLLYDLAKEVESCGQLAIPHHRTRSIWY